LTQDPLPETCSALCIGGVGIRINPPPGVIPRLRNPLYRLFLGDCPETEAGERMEVRLGGDAWPSAGNPELLFDTGDSWKMFRDGADYRLSLDRPGTGDPLWVACFGRGAGRVDLYCGFGPADGEGFRVVDLPMTYPLDQLLFMYFLALRRGALVHGAGMIHNGKAFVFPGVSGAGKSTLSELLADAGSGTMLSDERIVLREMDGGIRAYGTPWAGTAGITGADSAPLGGVFFLNHAGTNRIEPLDSATAADRLLPVTSIPWYDPDTAAPIIGFTRDLAAGIPAFAFHFVPEPSAVDCLTDFLSGGS